jgi:hemerythrin-like domain-containing protein
LLPISDYGDMAESIINHNAGYVCESESQIFETLELLWNKFKSGENLFIQQNEEFIESISREKIAENFVKLLLED